MRILLVEDNEALADGLSAILKGTGHAVDLVRDGASADAAIASENFDLVILDLTLPEMDGLEATRQIRQLSGCATLPIVAMTANAFTEDRERCRVAGMTDFMTKPIHPDVLFATLLNNLSKTR